MKREIKFRQPLWDEHNKFKGWHYWGFIDNSFIEPMWSPASSLEEAREQSQQYIGIKDKNRVEMYEKDYLKTPGGQILLLEIDDLINGDSKFGYIDISDCEVIGNIHEGER